jgi:FlaG/FlaF family flagellin (archaellin)
LQQSFFKKKTSFVGLILGIAFLVLLAAEFASFALGAYYVYDKPTSNVVAETLQTSSGTILEVNATGLDNASSRTIWIDPNVSGNSTGSQFIDLHSGFIVTNVTASSSGNISKRVPIDSSTLAKIQSDGQSVHTVWIIGIQPASGNLHELTSDSEQNYSASTRGSGIILFVTLITVEVPLNFNLGQLFIVLWTIYLILFAVALNGPLRSIWSAMKSSYTRGMFALFDNSMLATLIVFPVVTWVTVALSLLEQAGGIPTGSLPPADPLVQFVSLSIAPLREELGFRVIPIGVVALLILFSSGKIRDGLLALWHPSRYLKKNDSPENYKRHLRSIYVAIVLSAVLFGLAHVLLGAGWGPGKILSAAVAGAGLAGLYYVYGLPAAILLHWSIDYFLSTFDLNPSLSTAGDWITFYTLFLSVVGSVLLILLAVRSFRNRQLGLSQNTWFGRK